MADNTFKTSVISSLTTLLTLGAALLGWQAFADQNAATDNVPRLIPYHGTLEFNGDPVTATGDQAPWMRFEVYDGNGANASLLYEQDIQVEVYNGQFTTALGPTGANNTSLEGVVAYADDLYLKLTLLNDPDDDTDDIALANAQRLLVSPFALWATRSADFDVANDLEVARDVGIGRNLNVIGNAAVTGNSTLTGTLTANGNISDANSDVTIADGLIVTGNISDSDSDLNINDNLRVTGGTTLTGTLTISGNITDPDTDVTIEDGLIITGNLSDGDSAVTINDSLTVTGAITPSAGSATTNGINFPDNPGGGLNDDAWIRYYADGTGEDHALQIGINNDANDDIEFYQQGAVRLTIENSGNLVTNGNVHDDCVWEGYTRGTQDNGETLEGFCSTGRYVAGIRRWHGNFDYGIEELTLYCCRL